MPANLPFRKMNGLGNEIIVADMRGRAERVTPAAAARRTPTPATHFDQIMAIHDPRTPGTEPTSRIHNSDGSQAQACGNGMRCVGWRWPPRPGSKALHVRDHGRHARRRGARRSTRSPSTWASRGSAGRTSRSPRSSTTPAPSSCRSGRSTSRCCIRPPSSRCGNPHAIFWVERRLGLRSRPLRAAAREPSDLSRARQHLPRPGGLARAASSLRTWERGAGLTQACGTRRLRGGWSRPRAPGAPAARSTVTLPGGAARDRVARRRPCHA